MWDNFSVINTKEFEINLSSPHLHGGNDDIPTICPLTGWKWAENQLEAQPRAGIQSFGVLQALECPSSHEHSQGKHFRWSFVKGKIFTLKQGRWAMLRREWHSKLHVRALWCLQAMLFYGSWIFGSVIQPFEFVFLIWQIRVRVSTLRIPGFPY